ncbi:cytidine deaminase-like [Convolutriloba macropyga]|uniref:cytidine deaminase-like n=1 Tax=Convolutriloba macropyga TaxID=536237 RepID=UPI003F5242A2
MNSNQEETTNSVSLPAEVRNLLIEAKSRTYSPYSKFPVGCVLQLDNGEYIQGCNVENMSYSMTICAERSAIVSAISQGYKAYQMKCFYVTSDLSKCITPCGACRAVIAEMNPEARIVLVNSDATSVKQFSIGDLLPYNFEM